MIPLTQKLSFVPIFSAAQFSFLYISQDSDNISIRNQKKKIHKVICEIAIIII